MTFYVGVRRMNRSKKNERLGQVFTNTQGCEFKIIEYITTNSVYVQFLDSHGYISHSTYGNCQKGHVINPFYKSVASTGFLGVDENNKAVKTGGKNKKAYRTWHNMITRCYCEDYHINHPTYKDCEVCERWHCFANFLEDLPLIENYELWLNNKDIALDKDIKIKGNRLYSLDACCFLTRKENAKERTDRLGTPLPKTKVKAIHTVTGEVKTFNSLFDAEKQGFQRNCIRKCLQGEYQHHRNYVWKYWEDEE